ncbi:prolipoprotein diacylglyceryl transferase [Psychroserpens sp. SPM9]|uniref:prolipoprotein diacylglyceryl transferase n=1 Tax=Psychroserpens sp. SPM9 TaxID=2975598 RepID=UPI0021A562D0|nr:prolipoprotein diacylglyceryl transferase [Psychroserpens sp. SPM9]MDG5492551.1 prolipoprotein diacylglyceryl transferase [Psychroserpens sp. SPM9]
MHSELFQFQLPEFLKALFQVNTITIYAYPICILIGSLLAIYILRKKEKASQHYFFSYQLLLIVLIAAFIGGKLFLFFETPLNYIKHPEHITKIISGGYVFYGSFITCTISLILYLKIHNIAILKSLDIIVLSTTILHAFGRIGCFMAGCCYGQAFEFGMMFPKSYPHKVHPTQLYEAAFLLLVFLLLNRRYKTKHFHGEVFSLYLFCYAVGRFIIEFFRGDHRGTIMDGSVSHSQFIAFILCLLSSFLFLKLKRNSPSTD